jgi:hypothetical protein
MFNLEQFKKRFNIFKISNGCAMNQQILNDNKLNKFPFVKSHTLINKLQSISMKDLSE